MVPGQAAGNELGGGVGGSAGSGASADGGEWMKLAKDAYQRSTTYYENNYRKIVEDGLRLFNSQHPRDSKYNSDAYKYRARIFRPKTRSVIRKHEATAAAAFFSNPDVVSIDPMNGDDEAQLASSKIVKELLQYRLTSGVADGIPWFLTLIGAFQDAMTVGICASFQYWDYQSRKEKVKQKVEFLGQQIDVEMEKETVIVDKPCCELIPINNIRFDPASKWFDVVGTSPYIIVQMPMYLRDVLDRMEDGYGDDTTRWKTLDSRTILQARITEADPVQQARDNRKEDPNAVTSQVNEFDVVMVHLNFIRTAEGVFTYYTLKDLQLLSEPVGIEKAFLHAEIPVTIGFCVLETHQSLPRGLAQLGSQLQQEANEIANQRLDNVKFVLNKRWIVRRGANIDIESMLRNVPGGVTMANDTEKDVREVNWSDVTSSSFQEQDRLNVDFDDLEGGGLNSSSVMSNRRLNETVGGMKIMAQGANALTEYTIRVFVETWVEPTLRQLVKLEQHYESDPVVLAICGQRAGIWQRFNQSQDLDNLLKHNLTLSVNVGMGATDPAQRLQSFSQATMMYAGLVQSAPPDMNLGEVRKEIYGLAGFKDSKRFFSQPDPRHLQAKQMLQQAEAVAEKTIRDAKDRLLSKERALDNREHALDMQEMAGQNDLAARMKELAAEFQLEQQQQSFDFQQSSRKANQEMTLARWKAQQEAQISKFNARVDAEIKHYLAHATARAKAASASKTESVH